jgi:hypothetical protein
MKNSCTRGIGVIQMPWWEALLFFAAVILAIWGFVSIVGLDTRFLSRRTDRTAQDDSIEVEVLALINEPGRQFRFSSPLGQVLSAGARRPGALAAAQPRT